jgi:7,8-dihydro-6-hydroxymethylpterin-pyrophosphokinase
LGRVESEENRYGPRLIDLDIIFFGSEVIDLDELVVPHPSMHERTFVLKPLSDIAPDFIHPILKKSVSELLESLPIMDVETEHS